MTLEEAWDAEVTRNDARREIEAHGLSFYDFTNEVGDRDIYVGQEVLTWLGY